MSKWKGCFPLDQQFLCLSVLMLGRLDKNLDTESSGSFGLKLISVNNPISYAKLTAVAGDTPAS